MTTVSHYVHISVGNTEDMIEYLHKSVPVTMLADLKDSVRNNRDINVMDKYGATAVSGQKEKHNMYM